MQAHPFEFPPAALRVADDRVADVGAVDPQLVRPPGNSLKLKQRCIVEALSNPKSRLGQLPIRLDRPELLVGITADRRRDRAPVLWNDSFNKRHVTLIHALLFELNTDPRMSTSILRRHQQPGRIPVQAVDQPGTYMGRPVAFV